MSDQEHAHGDGHHRNYVKIWAILLALLVVSVLGPMLEILWLTLVTAFGIALVKAYLVVTRFMHINVEPRWLTYLMVTMLAFMGLFFAEKPPSNYREWLNSNYEFYDALAQELHEAGVIVEPDSREPWFLCEAHSDGCLDDTLERFERVVDLTMEKMSNVA